MRGRLVVISTFVGLACLAGGLSGATYAQNVMASLPTPPLAVIADDIAFGWKFVSGLLGLIGIVLTFLAGEVWTTVKRLNNEALPQLTSDFKAHAAVTTEKFVQNEKDGKERSERLSRVENHVAEAVLVAKESAQYVQAVAYRMGVATNPAGEDFGEPNSPTAKKVKRVQSQG